MPSTERFTRGEVLRIVGITPRQLGYWERLQLIPPRPPRGQKFYTFGDLVSLRTVKQLTDQHVPAGRLRQALEALRRQGASAAASLTELRIRPYGRRLAIEVQGGTVEPVSGQLLLDFGDRAAAKAVHVLRDRTLEEWFALALDSERVPNLRAQAMDAYWRVIALAPDWVEPYINLGTLLFEEGEPARAADLYRTAVELAPKNPLARFNLGTVLDELKDWETARDQLREAVRLDPEYADAHFNLARVCEKLGEFAEAYPHWQRYLELDKDSRWASYVRQRLLRQPGGPPQKKPPA